MKKIDRKDFLKIGGGAVVGGLTGTVFSGAPFTGLQWLFEWTQDQHVPPKGEEKYLKTLCESCSDKCEISIRMISDRAVKLETSNSGCPFGQNALQMLYHPERIDAPLKRTGDKGTAKSSSFVKVSWEEALKDISSKMNSLIAEGKGNQIAAINKSQNLSSDLADRLIKSAGSLNSIYEPSLGVLETAALGGSINYNFEKADYILSFGARLLEGWGENRAMNRAFAAWRSSGARLVQIDSNRTRTASIAERFVPIKPGTESIMALGIAFYLIRKKGKVSAGQNFGQWSSLVNQYTTDKVSKITGVEVKVIEEIAEDFSRARNPIAVTGRGAKGVSSSSAEITAVFALNSLVRSGAVSISRRTGLGEPKLSIPALKAGQEAKASAGLDDFIKNGSFEMLLVNEADPVYKSVYGKDLAAKMEKAFVVAVTPLINDSALYADYIFPSLTYLESQTSMGEAPLKPYAGSLHGGDIILKLARMTDEVKGNFPWESYVDLVKQTGRAAQVNNFSFDAEGLKNHLIAFQELMKTSSEYPLFLLPFESAVVGDGDGLAFPYTFKALDGHIYSEKKRAGNLYTSERLWVHINRETADKYGVSEGECIDIISGRGKIGGLYAHLTDTVAPDVVAIPLGFGHKAYTKYAEDKGANPKEIMRNDIDPLTGVADWWVTRVKIS